MLGNALYSVNPKIAFFLFCESWSPASLSSFLAKRGAKDEIMTFDARKISPEIREGCEDLLRKCKDSFDSKVSSSSHRFLLSIQFFRFFKLFEMPKLQR